MDKVYHDPKQAAAFGGKDALQRATKKSKSQIRKFLRSDDTYRKFFHRSKKIERARIMVSSMSHIFQCDLFDMTEYAHHNAGHKYLLLVVDCFSRYIAVRALKNKSGTNTAEKMREIFTQLKEEGRMGPLAMLGSDLGTEFKNQHAQKVYAEFGISWFPLRAPKKASLAEISGRYLVERIVKWMHHTGEKRYIDRLQDFVNAKNKRLNRSLGMRAPADISYDNQAQVYKSLFKLKRHKEPELELGDLVNIAPDRMPFFKNYHGYFGDKVYEVIRKVDYDGIKRYSLKDTSDDAEIMGSYYYAELLKKE